MVIHRWNLNGFRNRTEAGRILAELLATDGHVEKQESIVLGISHGGACVAAEVARRLSLPFDLLPVGTLDISGRKGTTTGAVTSNGTVVFEHDPIDEIGADPEDLRDEIYAELRHLANLEMEYRRTTGTSLSVEGKKIVIVDDGAATGVRLLAAIRDAKFRRAASVIVALPVASREALHLIREATDDTVCVLVSGAFSSVGEWYSDFRRVDDREVTGLLEDMREHKTKDQTENRTTSDVTHYRTRRSDVSSSVYSRVSV